MEPGLSSPIILVHHLHGSWVGEARQAFIGRGPLQDQRREIVKLSPVLVKQSELQNGVPQTGHGDLEASTPPFRFRGPWRKVGVLRFPGRVPRQAAASEPPRRISQASSSHTYQLLVVLRQGTGRRAGGHFVHGRNSHAGRVGTDEVDLHHLHGRAGVEHPRVIAHLEGEDLGGTSEGGGSEA